MSTKAAGTTSTTPKIEALQKVTEPPKVTEQETATALAQAEADKKKKKSLKKKEPPKTAAGWLCRNLRADLALIKRPIVLVQVEEEAVMRLRNVALEALATYGWPEIMPAVRKRIMEFVPVRLKELEKKGRKPHAWDGVLKITDERIIELVEKGPAPAQPS